MIDWTKEQREFIASNFPHYDNKALAGLVRLKFPGIRATPGQIRDYGRRRGLLKLPGVRERAVSRAWGKR